MKPQLRLLRPKQWIKNLFVFAPLLFAGRMLEPESWLAALLAALCFLCIACAVYIINDLHDLAEDRAHPMKKQRPLASGEVRETQAALMACALVALALFLLAMLPKACALVMLAYGALNVSYTFFLKRVAILDVFVLAFCYVLRVLMGGVAIAVYVSPWIILTTFFLALFLGFAKRYHEMGVEGYVAVKANLQHYTRPFLDKLVMLSGGSALITYAIYTAEVGVKRGQMELCYTVAFVAFGLFRYLQSVYVYEQGGEPETVILKDRWQLANGIAWLAAMLALMF